jgi:hypothetical protein
MIRREGSVKNITKFLIGTLAMLAPSAAAQDVVMALDPTLMTGWSGVAAAGEYAKQDFGTRLSRSSARRSSLAATPARPAASLAFRPDAAVRQQVHQRVLANIRKSNPQDAAYLKKVFESGAMRQKVSSYMRRYGMSIDNVADTTALYLATAWLATRADAGDPTPAQMRGLRAQVAGTWASMPQFGNATNAMKQEIAEANVIFATFAGEFAGRAARDPKLAAVVRRNTIANVRDSYQMDLSRLNLTSAGLR